MRNSMYEFPYGGHRLVASTHDMTLTSACGDSTMGCPSFVSPSPAISMLPTSNICKHCGSANWRNRQLNLHAATWRQRSMHSARPRGRRKLFVVVAQMVAAEPSPSLPETSRRTTVSPQAEHGSSRLRHRRNWRVQEEDSKSYEAQVETADEVQETAATTATVAQATHKLERESVQYHRSGLEGVNCAGTIEDAVPGLGVEIDRAALEKGIGPKGEVDQHLNNVCIESSRTREEGHPCALVDGTAVTMHAARARRQRYRRRRERAMAAARKKLVKEVAAMGNEGQWKEALAAADKAIAEGLEPDLYLYSSCVGAVAHSGRWREALDLLREMRAGGFCPNTAVYNAAIHACAVGGQWKLSFTLLREMRGCANLFVEERKRGPADGRETVESCGSVGNESNARADSSADHLEDNTDVKDRAEPDVQTFNTVMSACGRGGEWRLALDVMQVIRDRRLRPDRVTYNTAISACGTAGETDTAFELLGQMKEAGCDPDEISYNSAISAFARKGRWERALSLLGDMQSSPSVSPDAFSFSSAITACGKAGQWELALGVLDAMKRQGVRQGRVAFNAAINACERGGQWERAVELLREMESEGTGPRGEGREMATVGPDIVSYNAAIKACSDAGKWERALSLLDEMQQSGIEGVVHGGDLNEEKTNVRRRAMASPAPDVVSYSAAIAACGRAGEWDRALGLLDRMTGEGLKPNPPTFTAAITAFRKGGQARLVLHLMDRMREHGVKPDAICYGAALRSCADAMLCEPALSLIAEMQAGNVMIDDSARRAVATACAGSTCEWDLGRAGSKVVDDR